MGDFPLHQVAQRGRIGVPCRLVAHRLVVHWLVAHWLATVNKMAGPLNAVSTRRDSSLGPFHPTEGGPSDLRPWRSADERSMLEQRAKKECSMVTMKEAAAEFLASKRIAVTGVSRNPKGHGSNAVYQRLRSRGYEVFAVNPNADEVEGDPCYRELKAIPGGVEAVVIGTKPEHAEDTVSECAEFGIRRVWMHRGPGPGSVSADATEFGRKQGIQVIDGGCPLMYDPTADFAHKCMRPIFSLVGNVPKKV